MDSLRLATYGKPLSLTNLVSTIGPALNSYTGVSIEDNSPRCYGQVLHQAGKAHGQLGYIAPTPHCEDAYITALLEHLIQVSGRWGVRYLLADLAEETELLPAFRRADFTVWSRQKLLRFNKLPENNVDMTFKWRPWTKNDIKAMGTLHRLVVPKLFQNIEAPTRQAAIGRVLYDEGGGLLGYADVAYGPHGIWVQPMLAPQAHDPQILLDLLLGLGDALRRPIYLSLRAYQPWLEGMAAELPAVDVKEMELLVRYLVIQEEVLQGAAQPVFNGNQSESSVPVIQASSKEH